jgi:hypothetical protein
MPGLHRVLIAILILGNTVAFAGVDPVAKLATAVLALVMMVEMRRPPALPKVIRWAVIGLVSLVALQLAPLPEGVRRLLQPGFAEVMPGGWWCLSFAPWSTLTTAAALVVVAVISLAAMRIAESRSGLPMLLTLLTTTCCALAVLGLVGEAGAPDKVLLVRANTLGGDAYGPFVNSNHFAVAVELTLPAAFVLMAAAGRALKRSGPSKQQAAVIFLVSATVVVVGAAALLRSSSRGGLVFLVVAFVLTAASWVRARPGGRWSWSLVLVVLGALAVFLAWTRAPALRDGLAELFILEGVEGNTRWDLWSATLRSFERSPLFGSGLGSYRFVIGLDKPATGTSVLLQAHNDWLEWLSTSGLVGAVLLVMVAASIAWVVRPRRVRRLRHEFRYPLAAASLALVAVSLHELVGFGLQTPLNRYLVAIWIGLVLGVAARLHRAATERAARQKPEDHHSRNRCDHEVREAAAERSPTPGSDGGEP